MTCSAARSLVRLRSSGRGDANLRGHGSGQPQREAYELHKWELEPGSQAAPSWQATSSGTLSHACPLWGDRVLRKCPWGRSDYSWLD